MWKTYRIVAAIFALILLLFSPAVYSGTKVEDTIAYKSKEGAVAFHHKKHSGEYFKTYPELYKSACGECHHDKENKKLTNLKAGDKVQKCIECHKKQGYIKGKEARALTDKQQREYVANAVHDNCKGCHSTYSKNKKLKPQDKGYAPATCATCHDKSKK